MKTAHRVQHLPVRRHIDAAALARELGRLLERRGDAAEQPWQRAAGVRQDDLAVGELGARAHGDHVHGGAGRLVRIIDHGLGQARVDLGRVGGMRGVDEGDAFAAVELGPDRFEGGVAEVGVSVAVAGEERDAVSVEGIEGVSDFGQCRFGIKQAGQVGEEAEFRGLLVAYLGGVLVQAAGQVEGRLAFEDAGSRRSGGKDCCLDAEPVHDHFRGGLCPLRHRPSAGVPCTV